MDLLDAYLAAGRIRELAATLRARAEHAGALCAAIEWHSPAATVFRARSHAVCGDLVAQSCALDRLADAIHDRVVVRAHLR